MFGRFAWFKLETISTPDLWELVGVAFVRLLRKVALFPGALKDNEILSLFGRQLGRRLIVAAGARSQGSFCVWEIPFA